MSDGLEALERRVAEKWVAAAEARMPQWETEVGFGWGWADGLKITPLPTGTPQFPREQWASYPTKRTMALLLADRLLDFEDLTDEQWMTLCLVMQYGGKTRIA